jgi:hypothetical protein
VHLRGHHLGGRVAIAATAPHRSDIGAITEWLAGEVERLGVIIRLSSLVEPDVVAEVAPDEVIVATGSSPRRDGFQLSTPVTPVPGHHLPHVFSSWDVFGFGGRARLEGPAVVFDDTGTFEAISVADALLEAGLEVTMVGRCQAIGEHLPPPARGRPAAAHGRALRHRWAPPAEVRRGRRHRRAVPSAGGWCRAHSPGVPTASRTRAGRAPGAGVPHGAAIHQSASPAPASGRRSTSGGRRPRRSDPGTDRGQHGYRGRWGRAG